MGIGILSFLLIKTLIKALSNYFSRKPKYYKYQEYKEIIPEKYELEPIKFEVKKSKPKKKLK
jgi:hypothetical protein